MRRFHLTKLVARHLSALCTPQHNHRGSPLDEPVGFWIAL